MTTRWRRAGATLWRGSGVAILVLCLCGRCVAQPQVRSADDLFKIGMLSMQKGDFANARGALTVLVFEYPNDERQGIAHLLIAQAYMHDKDLFAAKLALERIVEKYADSKDTQGKPVLPSTLTYLGILYASMGQEDAARKTYERLQREFPDVTDVDGKKLVDSIPEEYRTGSPGAKTPSKEPAKRESAAPEEPAPMDDAAKRKIFQEFERLVDRAREEATDKYPKSLAKRKEYIAQKTDTARKALAAKSRISPQEIQAIIDEGKARGW